MNPRRRRERAVSWARLDDGDFDNHESTWDRTKDPHIKSVLLYQLSYGPEDCSVRVARVSINLLL